MVLRVKSLIFAACLCTLLNIVLCEENDEEASDEGDPIRQALLLIKLIRRAGAVLQENTFLSKHDVSVQSPGSPHAPHLPLEVSPYNNTNKISLDQRNARRFMSQENHRPVFYRRKDDYEGNEAPINTTTNTNSINMNNTTSTSIPIPTGSKALLNAPVMNTASVPSKVVKANNKPKHDSGKSAGDASKHKIQQLNQPVDGNPEQSADNAKEAQVKDPVMSQVATELENEMEQMSAPDRSDAANALQKFTKNNAIKVPKTKAPTTLRVHLGGSTRYPIPFPVNHALCYTNPENALCRTPL